MLPPGLSHAIAQTRLFSDASDYVVLRIALERAAAARQVLETLDQPFLAWVMDKDEVTVILTHAAWKRVRPQLSVVDTSSPYRLITLDIPLDLGLVGYLATLSAALAEVGISILAVSAFSRDHLLVPAKDFDRAWDTLWALIHSCQESGAER